jgi:hypothetical protein
LTLTCQYLQPPTTLEAVATGELDGVGRWPLTPDHGGTLMREAAEGLARRLDAELEPLSSESRPRQPSRALVWACFLIVLLALVVARWRGRT